MALFVNTPSRCGKAASVDSAVAGNILLFPATGMNQRRIRVTLLAACAPITSTCAMSAVFEGPLMKLP